MLENHFSCQKAANQRLHLYDSNQGALVYLDAVLVIVVILARIFVRGVLYIVVWRILRILMLLFVWSNHHVFGVVLLVAEAPLTVMAI